MLRVVRARIGNWMGRTSLQFPVDKTRLYGVEAVDTGDAVDSKKRQENQGFPANPVKTKWGRSSVG